jgi:hypothetical protein
MIILPVIKKILAFVTSKIEFPFGGRHTERIS